MNFFGLKWKLIETTITPTVCIHVFKNELCDFGELVLWDDNIIPFKKRFTLMLDLNNGNFIGESLTSKNKARDDLEHFLITNYKLLSKIPELGFLYERITYSKNIKSIC